MSFEYYCRKGTKMLRCGYTTGTCAVLASKAAAGLLLQESPPERVSHMTDKGIPVRVSVERYGTYITAEQKKHAWAEVQKDAGDDTDITDGMYIRADVSLSDEPGIHISGGKGVGVVTKPGLDQPAGNAAINSGPRRMISDTLIELCEELGYQGGLTVVISAPGGEEAAKKTFNSNLGIEGGISILGTTGIVEPMSEQALVDTIEVELRQLATETDRLIITPGNYGESFIKDNKFDEPGIPVLKISNFLGESLDIIATTGINTVLLIAHAGKLVKIAAGIMNTHSKYADGRNEIFCAHAAICNGGSELCRKLMGVATTDACIELLDEASLKEAVIDSILQAIQKKLDYRVGGKFRIGAIMFSQAYGLLGETDTAREILNEWEVK